MSVEKELLFFVLLITWIILILALRSKAMKVLSAIERIHATKSSKESWRLVKVIKLKKSDLKLQKYWLEKHSSLTNYPFENQFLKSESSSLPKWIVSFGAEFFDFRNLTNQQSITSSISTGFPLINQLLMAKCMWNNIFWKTLGRKSCGYKKIWVLAGNLNLCAKKYLSLPGVIVKNLFYTNSVRRKNFMRKHPS